MNFFPRFRRLNLKYILLLLAVTFLAFGQTINFYFWHDDYTILYSLQQPDSSAAGYGSGIIGRPYGYAVTPFIPFFYIFGLEARAYYFIGIILYFLASLAVYFLTKTLTDKKEVALGAALIFASGYVGSESMYALFSSWQNVLSAILITLSAAFYYRYIKARALKTYLLAFGVYLLTMEFAFLRSHGIVLIILGLEILFNFNFLRSIFRLFPFILAYWYFYVYSTSTYLSTGSKFGEIFNRIFIEKNYQLLATPIETLRNTLIPDRFNLSWEVFLVLLLGILIWKRSKVMLFTIIFIVSNFLVYFYIHQESPQQTTHRYLTISFVGAAIFLSVLLRSISKGTYKYLILCGIIVVLNIIWVRADQIGILLDRSQPSREFWQVMHKEIPTLPKRSAIYIDIKEDNISYPVISHAFGVGSSSTTASVAVHYGLLWEDTYLPENFPELLSLIKSDLVDKDKIYTFFYSREVGLVNTTKSTRQALFGDSDLISVNYLNNINIAPITPRVFKFTSNTSVDFTKTKYSSEYKGLLTKYLPYLVSRDDYYQNSSITSLSELKYAEIKNIKDKDLSVAWRGTEQSWVEKGKEEVLVNLGQIKEVGAIKLVLGALVRAPTEYFYECSVDGTNWTKLASLTKIKVDQVVLIDKTESRECMFIKLIIDDTVSHDAPQIGELEVIEGGFEDLDFNQALKIEEEPFKYIGSLEDQAVLFTYLIQEGVKGKICFYSDKYKADIQKCQDFRFKIGIFNSNEYFVEPGGTNLAKIEIVTPMEVKVSIENAVMENLNYDKLLDIGYILEYVD